MMYTSSDKTDSEINELHLTKLRTEHEAKKILQTTKITEELQVITYNRYTDLISI